MVPPHSPDSQFISQVLDAGRGTAEDGLPQLTLAHWPLASPFALFLSHDIDQIHDRELFRVLADANHLRRIVTQGETGDARLALRRIARALFTPKPATQDFQTLLQIEGDHGFRSSFYLLHDPYWSRHGPRYTFHSPAIHHIVRCILEARGEIGVHGGYYRFNNAAAYRESREVIRAAFGVDPIGIRNHHLRFSYPETWRAQDSAGFAYDTTYGWPDLLGPRDCLPFPFFPALPSSLSSSILNSQLSTLNLLELPLTVMDTTLFRYLRLSGKAALEAAWQVVEPIAKLGGLVSLLWHNNYFNEPEYWDWQMVYEELLNRLAPLRPWCATGQEINTWWRARAAVTVKPQPLAYSEGWKWLIHSPQELRNLSLMLRPAPLLGEVQVHNHSVKIERSVDVVQIHLPNLPAGSNCFVVVAPA